MAVNPIGKEISSWENKLEAQSANDFERIYDALEKQTMIRLNQSSKQEWFRMVDTLLFHSHAYLQGSALQKEARERLIAQGRIFLPEINSIEDMQSLSIEQSSYISTQEMAKGRLYAMAQGGAAGTGGVLLLGTDFPLQVIMNLRLVQLIAMGFGREIRRPIEMMLSLKVFQAATLPRRMQWNAWQSLLTETRSASDYMYQGNDELVDDKWLHEPIKQAVKSLLILKVRKKVVQGIPLLGIAAGAAWNYRLAKRVGEFSLRYYQKRCLL
ncbi:EcsC family protein [Sediminibacillus halophilus]|uniref:EcsC protein family protein n=1 Tax=Sediminibacillus halophilus TaxID=482461 RepID=A0A1G9Y6Z3_9BACI|nr:EcsC family protein [Sediminibacillus halophilus]SDN04770.1 EcsC protein family protein [Sediminibacillus halophilus]